MLNILPYSSCSIIFAIRNTSVFYVRYLHMLDEVLPVASECSSKFSLFGEILGEYQAVPTRLAKPEYWHSASPILSHVPKQMEKYTRGAVTICALASSCIHQLPSHNKICVVIHPRFTSSAIRSSILKEFRFSIAGCTKAK